MRHVLFRIMTIEDTYFGHYDDRAIVIFYKFTCSNLNDYEKNTNRERSTKKK